MNRKFFSWWFSSTNVLIGCNEWRGDRKNKTPHIPYVLYLISSGSTLKKIKKIKKIKSGKTTCDCEVRGLFEEIVFKLSSE